MGNPSWSTVIRMYRGVGSASRATRRLRGVAGRFGLRPAAHRVMADVSMSTSSWTGVPDAASMVPLKSLGATSCFRPAGEPLTERLAPSERVAASWAPCALCCPALDCSCSLCFGVHGDCASIRVLRCSSKTHAAQRHLGDVGHVLCNQPEVREVDGVALHPVKHRLGALTLGLHRCLTALLLGLQELVDRTARSLLQQSLDAPNLMPVPGSPPSQRGVEHAGCRCRSP